MVTGIHRNSRQAMWLLRRYRAVLGTHPSPCGHRNVWLISGICVVALAVVGCPCGGSFNEESKDSSRHQRPVFTVNDNSTSQRFGTPIAGSAVRGPALSTEAAASHANVTTGDAANVDIVKQEQRVQQDANTYQANEYGVGCNVADFSTYESCAQGEERTATNAQNDEAAATAQIQTDDQTYSSSASSNETVLNNFISQVVDLRWPYYMTTDVGNLVTKAKQFRSDLSDQAAVSASTPAATVSAIQAQLEQTSATSMTH